MHNRLKRFLQFSLLSLVVLVLASCGTSQNLGADTIADHLKLKASKDKIVYSERNCIKYKDNPVKIGTSTVNLPLECEQEGDIVKYAYYTDEVLTENFIFTRAHYSNQVLVSTKKVNKLDKDGKAVQVDENTVKFYGGDVAFKDDKDGKVYRIKTATTTLTAFDTQTKEAPFEKIINYLRGEKVFAQTTTDYYLAAGQGRLKNEGADFSTVRNAASGNGNFADGYNRVLYPGYPYRIERYSVPFDTRDLPDGASITGAKLYLYCAYLDNDLDDAYSYYIIDGSTQTNPTTRENADFGTCDFTAKSDAIDIGSLSIPGWNYFTLNGAGIAWINDNDYTSFMALNGHDHENQTPGGNDGVQWDVLGGTYPPYLEITYTEGGGATPIKKKADTIQPPLF